MKRHIQDFNRFSVNEGYAGSNQSTFTLYLVVDQPDNHFFYEIMPTLLMKIQDNHVSLNIKGWNVDGSVEFVFSGTEAGIKDAVSAAFVNDEGTLDMLEEPSSWR